MVLMRKPRMKRNSTGKYYVEDLLPYNSDVTKDMSLAEKGRYNRQRWIQLNQHREERRYASLLNDAKALMATGRTWYGKKTYTVAITKGGVSNQALAVLEPFFIETHTKTWKYIPSDEEILDFIKTIYKPKWT